MRRHDDHFVNPMRYDRRRVVQPQISQQHKQADELAELKASIRKFNNYALVTKILFGAVVSFVVFVGWFVKNFDSVKSVVSQILTT